MSGDSRPESNLVRVKNGYTSSTDSKLRKLNARIAAAGAHACDPADYFEEVADDEASEDEGEDPRRQSVLNDLRIGLHSDVEIPWGSTRFELLPPSQRQTVTQV